MSSKFIKLGGICLLVLISFITGRLVENSNSGYHLKVGKTEEHPFSLGPVKWSYVHETIGLPFLDPGTTVLEFQNRVLYKAKRGSQETSPYARDVKIDGNQIEWRDGDYQYHLKLEVDDTNAKSKLTGASQTDQTTVPKEAAADKS